MQRTGTKSRYCLSCFSSLPVQHDVVQTCGRCEFKNVAVDRRVFWNKNTKLVELERLLKVASIILLKIVTLLVIFNPQVMPGHLGVVAGWVPALSIALGVVLWKTVGKLTRHNYLFSPAIVWSATFMLLGASGVWLLEGGMEKTLAVVGGLVMTAGVFLWSRILENWKKQMIHSAGSTI